MSTNLFSSLFSDRVGLNPTQTYSFFGQHTKKCLFSGNSLAHNHCLSRTSLSPTRPAKNPASAVTTLFLLPVRCDSLDKLRSKLDRLLERDLADQTKFKEFYQFTFLYAKGAGQKSLDLVSGPGPRPAGGHP